MKNLIDLLRSNRGNAESSMVLIPLITLFLIGMQISIAVHERNVLQMTAQDEASKRAITGSFDFGDEFMHIDSSGDGQNLDLVIVRKEGGLIDLVPHILGGDSNASAIEVNGFAVVENRR